MSRVVCSNVGLEAWLAFAVGTAFVAFFVLRARRTQRWLRESRHVGRSRWGPGWILEERHLWAFRLLLGAYAVLFSAVGVGSVYCFFHGPG
jgi:hypothetical protein